jgi:hypothetical protein
MVMARKWWVVAAATVALVCAFTMLFWHRQPPPPAIPSIPSASEVTSITAQLNGNPLGQPSTGRFTVPKQFHEEVCGFFTGQRYRRDSYGKIGMDKTVLGHLHFDLKVGGVFDLSFDDAGSGVIGVSVDGDYFLAKLQGEIGGINLFFVLDNAREAAGVPLPPQYPPPIQSDENIVRVKVHLDRPVAKGLDVTELVVPDANTGRVMRWLRGAAEPVAHMWPESQRLGILTVTLKSGGDVQVAYYRGPMGETRFSIGKTSYRVLNLNSVYEDNINAELEDIIISEMMKRDHEHGGGGSKH